MQIDNAMKMQHLKCEIEKILVMLWTVDATF